VVLIFIFIRPMTISRTPPYSDFIMVEDMNAAGAVVGSYYPAPAENVGYVWTPEDGLVELRALDPRLAKADPKGINDSGAISGTLRGDTWRGFRWSPRDGFRDVGTLGGGSTEAGSIDELGRVMGSSQRASGLSAAFVWSEAEGMRDLGTPGGKWAVATAGNRAGMVVGHGNVNDWSMWMQQAFVWTEAGGTRVIDSADGRYAMIGGVNDAGLVVGSCDVEDEERSVPAVWTEEGGWRVLPTLNSTGHASDVNDAGFIAGWSDDADEVAHACLWTPDGELVDLGLFHGAPTIAHAINRHGVVAGTTETLSNSRRAWIWTADGGMREMGG
jgi:probable HAF family extracellular repeat protein